MNFGVIHGGRFALQLLNLFEIFQLFTLASSASGKILVDMSCIGGVSALCGLAGWVVGMV